MTIAEKIEKLRQSIREIASQVSRVPESIRFILVTKTVPCEKILEAYQAGIHDFGENRMQEFLAKKEELPEDIHWHFIGRLQTNKVKFLLESSKEEEKLPLVHSLDREELAKVLQIEAKRRQIPKVPCLIQVNSSGEATQGGFDPGEVTKFVANLGKDSPLWVRGLMTIGPFTQERNRIREAFRRVKKLGEELQQKFPERDWGILSMGMSSDYDIAIEEGANLLRIGSAVFGARR